MNNIHNRLQKSLYKKKFPKNSSLTVRKTQKNTIVYQKNAKSVIRHKSALI